MGTPIPPIPPVPPGSDCLYCTPGTFATGCTPSKMRVVFHKLKVCPGYPTPPNDVPIQIDQDPISPCRFFGYFPHDGYVWLAEVDLSTGILYLVVGDPYNAYAFFGNYYTCSPGPWPNIASCALDAAEEGTASLLDFVPPYIPLLATGYNLQPDARVLTDDQPSATPNHRCVRLTGRTYPGSVLIDLDLGAI